MKKQLLLAAVSAILMLTACDNSGRHGGNNNNPFGSLFGSKNSATESINQSNFSLDASGLPVYDKIDIDLTKLSSTLVYSEVYNMMNSPTEYKNKIVKVAGPFLPLDGDDPDYCYPAIYIADAAACCANGLEFLLYGVPRCNKNGGNGYPELREEVTIVGRFNTYMEGRYMYTHLEDAIWLKEEGGNHE